MAAKLYSGVVALALLAVLSPGAAPPTVPSSEPVLTSVFPFGTTAGQTFEATIRGKNLREARKIWFAAPGFTATVLGTSTEPKDVDTVRVRVQVDAGAVEGKHSFRAVTPAGISNELSFFAAPGPVLPETTANLPEQLPVRVEGRIAKRGDLNSYQLRASAGQVLTMRVRSGFAGFDPSVAILERSGSWFDPQRLNRVAFNDEPLFFPGLSTDAHLVHRFERAGEYVVQVGSFSGAGGPEYAYELSIAPGERAAPVLHPSLGAAWEERQFTRPIRAEWLQQLHQRAGKQAKTEAIPVVCAVVEGTREVPVFTAPAVIEGRIGKPGEAHVIRVRVEKAQDLAIEVETPEATMPVFNPVVRVSEADGNELLTNVYTKLNNNGLYMMKMIQAKTTFSAGAPGVYTLQIRDITTDRAGDNFAYRVLVRPQIPHAGKMTANADHFNVKAGETRLVSVQLEREEEFAGTIALSVENLPPGLTTVPAAEQPVERPALPNGGKLERYTPKPQTVSLLLSAAPDAPMSSEPALVRIVARPVSDGRLGEAIPVAEVPVMVVAK